jgi:hypothetical protein
MEKKKSRNGFEKSSVDQSKQHFCNAALLPVLGNKPALVYGGWKAQKGMYRPVCLEACHGNESLVPLDLNGYMTTCKQLKKKCRMGRDSFEMAHEFDPKVVYMLMD